jgi:CDP-diacylglycerol---glycerol-3-phosphate 3-phosphatidyltransferase
MCHPWLAAGITGFVIVLLIREFGTLDQLADGASSAGDTGLLGVRLRLWFRRRLAPLADALVSFGLTANGVTFSQLVASAVCGLAYAYGWMFTAGWMLIASGTLDVLDGEMARRDGAASPRGAFMDSVVDRYGEAAVFAGLAVFYRDVWVLWSVLAAWLGAYLVSYTRARAEGLGADCRGGLLQRPERYVILGGTSIVSAVALHVNCGSRHRHAILALGICVVAVLANATALQRAHATLRKLS